LDEPASPPPPPQAARTRAALVAANQASQPRRGRWLAKHIEELE
jgi:hypothetical protein